MLSKHEHLIAILGEKAAEVSHICAKILRFGLDTAHPFNGAPINKEVIYNEMVDAIATYKWLAELGLVKDIKLDQNDSHLMIKINEKREAIQQHMKKSIKLGHLESE